MDIKPALKGQYRAGFAMLRQCIERCQDDLWAEGEHPRTYWRIAYHTVFYTHLYLMQNEGSFVPWEKHQSQARILWDDDEEGIPPHETTYTQAELLEYLAILEQGLDGWMEALELESPESGFSWYKIPKLDHQLVNLRHLGIHIGQLQELMYARGIDLNWVSIR